jgi:hypothetical protein
LERRKLPAGDFLQLPANDANKAGLVNGFVVLTLLGVAQIRFAGDSIAGSPITPAGFC